MRMWRTLAFGLLAMIGSAAAAQADSALAPSLAPPQAAAVTAREPATPPAPAGPHPLTKADIDAWLDGYLPYALHSGDIAGAVVVVVRDGQVLTGRGYGFADVAKRIPVDPARTLFPPGSVSKLVTWTAVMQQVEAGRIDLDRDVNAYLDFRIPPYDDKPVTMRQLLTHTAGFEEATRDIIFTDPKRLKPLGTYLKGSVPPRIFAPGVTPAYSNWGTTLAAYIVERVSGQPFDDYLDQRIFAPLGMRDATFRQPLPARLRGQMATGYRVASGEAKPFEIVGPAPAGSMSASGVDMARFMVAHLEQGRGILRPETARTMHDSPLDRIDPRSLIPPLNRMELGFFETDINGREVIAHLGDTEAFHTSLHLFLDERTGFYVSFNSAGTEGAVGTLRTALFYDFADRYFPAAPTRARVDPKQAAVHARALAGNWWTSRRSETNFLAIAQLIGQTTVAVGPKNELVVSALTGLNGQPRRWVEVAPFVWNDPDSRERLAAQVVDGKPVRWSIDLIAPFIVFDRVPAHLSAAWLVPAAVAGLGVLALTTLQAPVAWAARRRYGIGARGALAGTSRRAARATRLMALLVVLVVLAWAGVITALFGDIGDFAGTVDPWLMPLQILGAVVFVGAVGVAAWNAWQAWRDGRAWTRKLWSVLVLAATLVLLYIAVNFGLIEMTARY